MRISTRYATPSSGLDSVTSFAVPRQAMPAEILKSATSGVTRPSMVLMDLNLPGIDGRDALSEIKADPELRKLPVVVLSTSSNPLDLEFCYSAGAKAYHVKSVRYLDHLDILAQVFKYWLDEVVLLTAEGHPG